MPTTYTPALGLNLPEIGAARDTWGTLLNQNTSTIDLFLAMAMPIGAIIDFAGPNPPSGFLFCDGRLISRTTYSKLFAVIGTYWGSGDGSTNFALPPTPGRTTVCVGTVIDQNGTSLTYTFAQQTGALSAVIAQANLPAISLTSSTIAAHNHGGATAAGANHTHNVEAGGGGPTDTQGTHAHGGATGTENATHVHNYSGIVAGVGLAGGNNYSGSGTLQTSGESASHNHGINNDGAHLHNMPTHSHVLDYSGNLALGINLDGSHNHVVPLGGSGTYLPVTNPLLAVTKIIYAGQEASTTTFELLAAPPAQRRLSAPMRGSR